ncbi:MAG: hypothetical protein HKN50_06675 [Gammaproteobacteria bacterium]|nr:hypothetical protein [Gammaproteobacteria bacterium]
MTEEPAAPHVDNWTLIRDVAVIQVKLIVDGLRDLVLVPLTLVSGIASLVTGIDGKPGGYFYRLLAWGKRSERWIDLFGALRNAPDDIPDESFPSEGSLDDMVSYVESVVVKEHHTGRMTRQAKDHIDKALARIQSSKQTD